MKTQISIPLNTLLGITTFASPTDHRLWMRGVLVRCRSDGIVLVATNGVVLGGIYLPGKVKDPQEFIIPYKTATGFKPAKKKDTPVNIEYDSTTHGLLLRSGSSITAGTAVCERFADFSKILPEVSSGIFGQFNPKEIAKFVDASALLFGEERYPYIQYDGTEKAARVCFGNTNFFGAAAPLETDKPDPTHVKDVWVNAIKQETYERPSKRKRKV